mgnify:FL=1
MSSVVQSKLVSTPRQRRQRRPRRPPSRSASASSTRRPPPSPPPVSPRAKQSAPPTARRSLSSSLERRRRSLVARTASDLPRPRADPPSSAAPRGAPPRLLLAPLPSDPSSPSPLARLPSPSLPPPPPASSPPAPPPRRLVLLVLPSSSPLAPSPPGARRRRRGSRLRRVEPHLPVLLPLRLPLALLASDLELGPRGVEKVSYSLIRSRTDADYGALACSSSCWGRGRWSEAWCSSRRGRSWRLPPSWSGAIEAVVDVDRLLVENMHSSSRVYKMVGNMQREHTRS